MVVFGMPGVLGTEAPAGGDRRLAVSAFHSYWRGRWAWCCSGRHGGGEKVAGRLGGPPRAACPGIREWAGVRVLCRWWVAVVVGAAVRCWWGE